MDKPILLVADDEEMNREVIKRFLKNDYEIVEAINGREALAILQNHHIDVVLLDIIMPELDGLELLKRIKEDDSFSSIGFLVATSTKEKTERQALSYGADDIVAKPYDPTVIKVRLSNILAKKNLEQYVDSSGKTTGCIITDKARQHVRVIETASNLLLKNRGNKQLVEEFARQINEQATMLSSLFNKDSEGQA